MWLQHRGKWNVTSEATGERVELEFGCFNGAASGEFAAALKEEAEEASRLFWESGEGGGGGNDGDASPPSCSNPPSCAESFETVGFAPGAALSERDRAVAAKRRALREVRGRLVVPPPPPRRSGSGGGCHAAAAGITLAGAWDSGLVVIDDSAAVGWEEEEGREGGNACSSSSSSSSTSLAALAPPRQGQRTRGKKRSIIWTAAVDATSPVARGDNRYCMSRWTLALNEEDGAAEAAATRAAATPRFGASASSSSSSSSSSLSAPPRPHHDSLSLPQACHTRSSVAFRAPPPTDSRRRPDLRAVEHGNWEAAAAARDALLAAQARRVAGEEGDKHEPAWFRVRDPDATAGVAFMFEYAGGYWADRKRRAEEEEVAAARAAEESRKAAPAAAAGENDDGDDHLFFDAQEAPF